MSRNITNKCNRSLSNQIKDDNEDFWKDCFGSSVKENIKKVNYGNTDRNNYTILNEENESKGTKNKELNRCQSQKAIQNCCQMYERWKNEQKKRNQKRDNLKKILKNKEMKQCTWKPKTNKWKATPKLKNDYSQYKKKTYIKIDQDENSYKPNVRNNII